MEQQYNNRARVPEHLQIMEEWARQAATFRTEHAGAILDIAYGPGQRNTYDLFPAASGTTAQGLTALFIHGGYWQALEKSSFSHMARGLNARGFDVTVANYSLCPEVRVSDIVSEIQKIAGHVYKTHGRRLLVVGHSAGGHLAATLMATNWSERGLPTDLVPAAMPISGLFDLSPLIETSINNALALDSNEASAVSPIKWSRPDAGRYCAVVGGEESDEYLRQSRLLVETWSGLNLRGVLNVQSGANHFTVINPLADPGSPLTATLAELALAG